MTSDKKIFAGPAAESLQAILLAIKTLAEAGTFKPVIDRHYPLERIVEAHAYVDTGHKKGKCRHHCWRSRRSSVHVLVIE